MRRSFPRYRQVCTTHGFVPMLETVNFLLIYFQIESVSSSSKLTLEVAVFFDEIAYKTFAPYFEYDVNQMKNMLLAYMNMVRE